VLEVASTALSAPYVAAGLTPTRDVRVLARYGGAPEPRFVELELDDRVVVTVPYELARTVTVALPSSAD
jgi:hypothetical protein